MKKSLTLLILLAVCLGATSTAEAGNETIGLAMEATPTAGPLYRELARPVQARLDIDVSVPANEEKVTPLKVANVTFPADMDFYPDPKKTPACPESKVGADTSLAIGVLGVVAQCPRSVVGTGTATIQLAKAAPVKYPNATLDDPQMVVFNAGRDKAGRPKITIYAYSKRVNTGVVMRGTLAANGELKIDIGVLPFDSSVSRFTFEVPGSIEVEDTTSPTGTTTVKGLDPAYLRAKCSTGVWTASGSFVLGERDEATGLPVTDDVFLDSNTFDLPCQGRAGKAKLKIGKVAGPKRIKSGRKGAFTVTVTNPGTAPAKSVRLVAGGKSVKVGTLAAGASRKVRIKVRASGRSGTKKINFRLVGKGLRAAAKSQKITIK